MSAKKTVASLHPAPYNPRKISDEQLAILGKTLAEFGDLSGIVVNRTTGNLVGGHQRLKHLDPKWPIMADPVKDKTGGVAVGHIVTPWGALAYREVEWSEQKEKAANIAANKAGGEFDIPKLKDLLIELDDGAFDLKLTGFTEPELKALIDFGGTAALPEIEDKKSPDFRQMTFILSEGQFPTVVAALKKALGAGNEADLGNENKNGNALHKIALAYVGEAGDA